MRIDYTSDLWWKNAVIYALDVETYSDSDGDGVGDFRGLIDKVDYLAGLGVTCLWLMPFYPSPNRDDGYDISDYYGVDPRLGTLGDFVELVRTCNDRGMRVIVDLVVNHTSDEHPWFTESRASVDSARRQWYVWRPEPADEPEGIAFPDKETSNWQLDGRTGEYYLHRFYRFQPDLNIATPAVRDEICKIAAFWLALGASGFRMDAVPFVLELEGIGEHGQGDARGWLTMLRRFISRRDGQAMLLGEVNTAMKDVASYFGPDGDALHMEFAFLMNQSLWLSLARGDAEPLEQLISTLPTVPHDNAWATFLRNHDELTLDKLTVSQREEVFKAFAPRSDMRLYGHGIRRRTASMLGGDGPRLRMAWSLMFSLPGTPVMFMGDEIGMGEQRRIPDRYAVRVPMQWTAERNGGFSTAPAGSLVRPMAGGAFAASKGVNVEDQRRDPGSLLRFVRELIRTRRETPELGWGRSTLIETSDPALFAHRCDWEESSVIAIHNLSARPATAELPLGAGATGVHDLLADTEERTGRGGALTVELEGYGGRWLRVRR